MLDPFDGFSAFGYGLHDFVVGHYGGVRDVFVLELYGITEPFALCCFDMTFVCVIMLG